MYLEQLQTAFQNSTFFGASFTIKEVIGFNLDDMKTLPKTNKMLYISRLSTSTHLKLENGNVSGKFVHYLCYLKYPNGEADNCENELISILQDLPYGWDSIDYVKDAIVFDILETN